MRSSPISLSPVIEKPICNGLITNKTRNKPKVRQRNRRIYKKSPIFPEADARAYGISQFGFLRGETPGPLKRWRREASERSRFPDARGLRPVNGMREPAGSQPPISKILPSRRETLNRHRSILSPPLPISPSPRVGHHACGSTGGWGRSAAFGGESRFGVLGRSPPASENDIRWGRTAMIVHLSINPFLSSPTPATHPHSGPYLF